MISAAPFQQISVFEPDLRAFGSHHVEYVQLLRGATNRAGISLRVFGHREVSEEVRRLTGTEPLFADVSGWQRRLATRWPSRQIGPLRAVLTTLHQNWLASSALAQAFCTLDWERQLILVPNCHQGLVAALAYRLRGPLRREPSARAVLVFPYYPSRHVFRQAFRTLVPLLRTGRVVLATDSEPLGELYHQLTGFRFPVLPMPYGAGGPEEPSLPRAAAPGRVRFLVCGGYRLEKGIDLIADLIEGQETAIRDGRLAVTLHGFTNDTAPEPLAAQHFARIRASSARCPPGSIVVVDSALSSADYHRLFSQNDAALLPYRRGPYSIRTSGILTECLARGLPVITTADTWLGQQVQAHGAGLVFPDGDVRALTQATRQMAADLPRFAAAARDARPGWVAFHNPENYLRTLTRLPTLDPGK